MEPKQIPNRESVGFQCLGPRVTRKCTPGKTGTFLEPCWNLSLLGYKAGLIEPVFTYLMRPYQSKGFKVCAVHVRAAVDGSSDWQFCALSPRPMSQL